MSNVYAVIKESIQKLSGPIEKVRDAMLENDFSITKAEAKNLDAEVDELENLLSELRGAYEEKID